MLATGFESVTDSSSVQCVYSRKVSILIHFRSKKKMSDGVILGILNIIINYNSFNIY